MTKQTAALDAAEVAATDKGFRIWPMSNPDVTATSAVVSAPTAGDGES